MDAIKFNQAMYAFLKSIRFRAFCLGFLVSSCVRSLFEDSLGKEEFLKYAASHWVESSLTVPIALAVLCFCLWSYFDLFPKPPERG